MIQIHECKPGIDVWYRPNLAEPRRFSAIIETDPWLLGHGVAVCHIRDLPDEYGAFVGTPGRRRVRAVALVALEVR